MEDTSFFLVDAECTAYIRQMPHQQQFKLWLFHRQCPDNHSCALCSSVAFSWSFSCSKASTGVFQLPTFSVMCPDTHNTRSVTCIKAAVQGPAEWHRLPSAPAAPHRNTPSFRCCGTLSSCSGCAFITAPTGSVGQPSLYPDGLDT